MKKACWRFSTSTILLTALLTIVLCVASIAESAGAIRLVKPTKPSGWVNVRTEPSLDSEGLARATLNQEVIVLGIEGEWAQVIFDGQEGYMKVEFLSETDDNGAYTETAAKPSTSGTGYEMKMYTEAPNPKSTVSIEYPYFSDNAALNTMIQQKIQNMLKYPSSYYPQLGFTADYKATVTLNNSKMVSILFVGDVAIEKGRPGTVVATLNVDLASMREMMLADLYDINEGFEKVYLEKAYYPTKPVISNNASQFKEMLLSQSRESNLIGPFAAMEDVCCFLKLDGIVISSPASGSDSFEAQLNYSDIQQFYLPSQNYW